MGDLFSKRVTSKYEAKYPKVVESLVENKKETLAYYDYPAKKNWRKLKGFQKILLVLEGNKFVNGVLDITA